MHMHKPCGMVCLCKLTHVTSPREVTPLALPPSHCNRPVTSLAFSPVASDPHLLVAYGPVGAQLGAAELIKVRGGKNCRRTDS